MTNTLKSTISGWLNCGVEGVRGEAEEQLRLRILEESFKLFSQSGIKNVTMDEIARQMGISKKTIYQCFESKDDIVNAILETHISCLSNQNEGNIIEQIFFLIDTGKEILSRLNPMIFHDLQKHYPKAWKIYQDFSNNHCMNMIKKQIEIGVEQGYFREDIQVDILIRLRVLEMEMPFNQTHFSSTNFSISQVMSELSEHFIYGLCTAKGYEAIENYKIKKANNK